MSTKDTNQGIRIGSYLDSESLTNDLRKYLNGEITFFCIGTDRSTGDSFGPLIGTMLEEKGYRNVIGTIDEPCHANNLQERTKEIPNNTTILAIDASLGHMRKIGTVSFNRGEIQPGLAMDKQLPRVGDFHITGVVNVDCSIPFHILQNTRLSKVIKMAKTVTESIEQALPLYEDNSLRKLDAK